MMNVLLAASLLAVSALAGCSVFTAPAPVVHLHTLLPADPPPRAAGGGPPTAIVVDAVRVPAQVDQPQMLVRYADDTLASLEQERWASPLADELRQALVEGLLSRANVYLGAPGVSPSAVRIALELRRFDTVPGREVRIEGTWTLQATGGARRCDFSYREAAEGGLREAELAHRRAVAKLADAIAPALLPAANNAAADCPAR